MIVFKLISILICNEHITVSWNPRVQMFDDLAVLYNRDIGSLDAYVGGMLESSDNGPGELFSAIIKDQFIRLRDSDR